jgi:ADP-dependent NAD(P)H-hydrate dehydratase
MNEPGSSQSGGARGEERDAGVLPRLPRRDPRGHKGTFGTVLVLGGCAERRTRMIGAPALAVMGALRAGAGLARVVAPEPVLNHIIMICPAATGIGIPVDSEGGIVAHEAARILDEQLATMPQALAVGPGLGTGQGPRAAVLRTVQQEETPVILDADGLNCIAAIPELWRDFRAAAILTPHPGEYRRLAQALQIESTAADPVRPESRPAAAELLAQRLGCVVVLKGAGTVVSDGQRTWVCSAADSVLAAGGSGDVLAGLIAGLVAQFVALPMPRQVQRPATRPLDLFDAARLGVQAHTQAAAIWMRRHRAGAGMMPVELADCLPEALDGMM